jgi:Zn-dependent protease with chaperone function
VDEVHELFPFWIGWVQPAFWMAGGFVTSWLVTRLGVAVALPGQRAWSDAHWTERARLTLPGRTVATILPGIALGLFAALSVIQAGSLSPFSSGTTALAVGLAAFFGGSLVSARVRERTTGRRLSTARWMGGTLLTVLVFVPQVFALAFMNLLIEPGLGLASAVGAGVGIACLVASCHSGGLPVARWLGAVRPASARLAAVVQRASERTRISPAGVEELDIPMVNALAFPWSRRLLFTRRAVEGLDDGQLYAIACHELAHLAEPPSAKLARCGPLALFLPLGFVSALIRADRLPALVILYGVCFLAISATRGVLRRLEERADDTAQRHQDDEGTYAAALERVYELNLAPAVAGRKRGIHPDLYDRIVAAGGEPTYPRPAPPPHWRTWVGGSLAVFVLAVAASSLAVLPLFSRAFLTDHENGMLLHLALTGGNSNDLRRVASLRGSQGRWQEAARLAAAAVHLAPHDHASLALSAQMLGMVDRCEEASRQLERSRAALADPSHAMECPWISTAQAVLSIRCAGHDIGRPAGTL